MKKQMKWFMFARQTGLLTILLLLISGCSALPPTTSATATPGNQTGLPEIDRIITIALSGKVAELRPLIAFTQTTCTFKEGLGGPPRCQAGEQEGSPLQVLPFLGPEGHFIRKEAIESWEGLAVSTLYAVYQVSGKAFSDPNYPAGEYAIVLLGGPEAQTGITLQVRQGQIVRIDYSAGFPPPIRPEDVSRYLLPPSNTTP